MNQRLPVWLKRKTPQLGSSLCVADLLKTQKLHTVCENARCPNLLECFGKGTATFLIMGEVCTRACRFCAVKSGRPEPLDKDEPARLARTVKELGLRHLVITSVTRDDLTDGGAGHFARVISHVREACPDIRIEVLTPDFGGSETAIRMVVEACPDIFNHNIETVPRLYPTVRAEADYQRSLKLLSLVKELAPQMITKSGLMLGLGEESSEVAGVLNDLRSVGCDIVTLGQYLKPTSGTKNMEVVRFITPEEFADYRQQALTLGFKAVAAGPYVRSSYAAEELMQTILC